MNPTFALTHDHKPRKQKRSDRVAESIRLWITEQNVAPGEKLPPEAQLIELFGVSKGTIREALKALEIQGLIRVRTGPGGGASVTRVPTERTLELLGNHFYARDLSLRDIYAMRKVLEPELAAAVCGRLSTEDLDRLEAEMCFCSCEPMATPVDHAQRLSELDFHDILAEACPNELLGMQCRFINSLLKNLAVCRRIYEHPHEDLRKRASSYHQDLAAAFRRDDPTSARAIMREHMMHAEEFMLECEARIEPHFLAADSPLARQKAGARPPAAAPETADPGTGISA